MKTVVHSTLLVLLMQGLLWGTAWASHDAGQGKSRDGNGQLSSLAVAPEPPTSWTFLFGVVTLTAWTIFRRSNKIVPAGHTRQSENGGS